MPQSLYHVWSIPVDTSWLFHCTTESNTDSTILIGAHITPPTLSHQPRHFHDILHQWSGAKMWHNMTYMGNGEWVYTAIQDSILVCASDGTYTRQLFPDVCAAAVILECNKGYGRLTMSLIERSSSANAFQGELLGLLMIHLFLLSVHTSHPNLRGSTTIYSDCYGAL